MELRHCNFVFPMVRALEMDKELWPTGLRLPDTTRPYTNKPNAPVKRCKHSRQWTKQAADDNQAALCILFPALLSDDNQQGFLLMMLLFFASQGRTYKCKQCKDWCSDIGVVAYSLL